MMIEFRTVKLDFVLTSQSDAGQVVPLQNRLRDLGCFCLAPQLFLTSFILENEEAGGKGTSEHNSLTLHSHS